MKRRDFLKCTVPATALPFLIGGYSLTAYGRSPWLDALVAAATMTDRVLVLVQLNGGNDGLNMVIPLDQYAALSSARANILIDAKAVLTLSDVTGLHPAMTKMQSLYLGGKLAVVQGVSYPTPNFSHFRATDIWLTGADYTQTLTTGWMGRFLDEEYPGYPTGYPNTSMPDPPAIQIGSTVSQGLQGKAFSMGLAISDPNATYPLSLNPDNPPSSPAGNELTFIRNVALATQVYSGAIKTAAGKFTNKSTLYPTAGQNSLADQLKIVARLVAGGLKTRIYVVNIGGFDTHASQVDATDHGKGTHATLLGRLSDAVAAFLDDLALLGVDDRVIGMTFSEFGRRIKSNTSSGTDHGTAAPMFIFGKKVNPGIVGSNPVIPASGADNLTMQYDFRNVYASVLKNWFGTPQSELQKVLYTTGYTGVQILPIISPSAVASADEEKTLPREYVLYQNYPNPFNPTTVIRYALPRGADVMLEVYDTTGRLVRTLLRGEQDAGEHEAVFDATGLASGAYFYKLRAGDFTETKKLLIVR